MDVSRLQGNRRRLLKRKKLLTQIAQGFALIPDALSTDLKGIRKLSRDSQREITEINKLLETAQVTLEDLCEDTNKQNEK